MYFGGRHGQTIAPALPAYAPSLAKMPEPKRLTPRLSLYRTIFWQDVRSCACDEVRILLLNYLKPLCFFMYSPWPLQAPAFTRYKHIPGENAGAETLRTRDLIKKNFPFHLTSPVSHLPPQYDKTVTQASQNHHLKRLKFHRSIFNQEAQSAIG